jgi:Zn-dependent protease
MSAESLPENRSPQSTSGADIVDLAAVPPVDGTTAAVIGILDREPQQRTWLQSALLLGVSIVIFAATGFFNNDPSRLALLVGVLLFHELGHYAGMRLFNYQDVQMFFIPLFGAAVAGRTRSIEGYKEGIVLLLGPLPGIFLGAALGVIDVLHPHELLHSAAMLLVVINGFNLLPFMPLDGGRLLHLVLFSRQPVLEAVFRVLTGGLLALCGLALGGWMLAFAGGAIIFGTPHVFRLARLAQMLRGPVRTGEVIDLSAKIPYEWAVALVEAVRQRFPRLHDPNLIAKTVRQAWERIHLRPPGLGASLLLLLFYGLGFFAAPVMALLISLP